MSAPPEPPEWPDELAELVLVALQVLMGQKELPVQWVILDRLVMMELKVLLAMMAWSVDVVRRDSAALLGTPDHKDPRE